MVWLNLPRSPTRVKAITLQKNRVKGKEKGHPAFSFSPPLGRRDAVHNTGTPFASSLLLFFITLNDRWPSLRWVGREGPVYQGQDGGWTSDTHTHTLAELQSDPWILFVITLTRLTPSFTFLGFIATRPTVGLRLHAPFINSSDNEGVGSYYHLIWSSSLWVFFCLNPGAPFANIWLEVDSWI